MPFSVYIETSVVSYHAARPSRDLVTAARQTMTEEWWEETQGQYDRYVSVLVIEEANAGDAEAARRRIQLIAGLPVLEITKEAEELAGRLVADGFVPKSSVEDALHIAVATVHGMDFLVTWNFRHINNAEMRSRIKNAVEAAGYECPTICSPEELGGNET